MGVWPGSWSGLGSGLVSVGTRFGPGLDLDWSQIHVWFSLVWFQCYMTVKLSKVECHLIPIEMNGRAKSTLDTTKYYS